MRSRNDPTQRRGKTARESTLENPCKKLSLSLTTLDVRETESMTAPTSSQDDLYREAVASFGAALERLAGAYEADPEIRRDLLQDIHIALWRSF